MLLWLQQAPDATAKALFGRLKSLYLGQFTDGQLRTLQRRVREWWAIMAKELVYASLEENEPRIVTAIGTDS